MNFPKLSKCTAAPQDGLGAVLGHVLVSGPNATATDGRLLVTVPHGLESAPDVPTLVPTSVWEMMEKAKRPPILETATAIVDNGVRIPLGECPDAAAFPSLAKFEPTEPPTAVVRLDVRLLMLLAQAIRYDASSKAPLVVTLKIHGENRPVHVSSDYSEGSGLLMPCAARRV